MTICTRSFADVVSSADAAMDRTTVASLSDVIELRKIAKRYNVSVRRGANAETIRRQLHTVMEPMDDTTDAAHAELSVSDSSANLRRQSCTHDAAHSSEAGSAPAAQQRPPRGLLHGDACVYATAVDADSDHVTAQTAQGDSSAASAASQPSTNAAIASYVCRIASLEAENAALHPFCGFVMIIVQSWRVMVPAGFEWTMTLSAGSVRFRTQLVVHVALGFSARACG